MTISMLHCLETLALPCPFVDVLAGVDSFGFFSEVLESLPCMGRKGVVVEDALSSPLTDCSVQYLDLVVIAKGGEQQER